MTATDIEIPSSIEQFERCAELGDKVRQLSALPESKRGDNYQAEMRSTVTALNAENALYDLSVKRERDEMERMAFEDAVARARNMPEHEARGPQAAFGPTGFGEQLTPGEQFVRAMGSEKSETIEHRNMVSDSDGIEVRNLLTSTATGTPAAGLFAPVGSPQLYVPPRRRRLFVRDLLDVVPTNLNSIPYIRELNAATNETGATAVAEASAKPEVTMEFERDDAPIRKLAAWVQATEEILEDAPIVRGYIDGRLAYMLMLREESQVIGVGAGGGNAPNIKGILDFTGVQTNSGLFYDGVGTSIGKIEVVDGDADGVVANPTDYWAAVTDRHATFYDGNAFGSGGNAPFGAPQLTAWGLPVVRSRSLASGTAIVGSWGLGATLFERRGTTIRTTDSHASLFVSNTWIILAEERVGLAVHRPDFFVKLTVSPPTTD